ncbi:hypothetical protein [Lactobacillus taiwanensis]|uniref:hypothetical protein n=1 Tax=Lactobacillus taiwanensis TaxID=508451 RepID=UPI0025A950CA|nr:hypothetical protein [Lactobacillus taiwanensis]
MNENILNMVLVDDCNCDFGGVAFNGETVRDFISEMDNVIKTVAELNNALADCGIKTISLEKNF